MPRKISSPKKEGVERRRASRADRVVAISHRLIKRGRSKEFAQWSLSSTKNMSVTGILFLSETPYKVGDIVEVHVTMSGIIDIVKGFAQVVRVQMKTRHSYHVAIHFIEMKGPSRRAKAHL